VADGTNTNTVLADPITFGSELLAGGFESANPIQSHSLMRSLVDY
jgi:hypothetical protein